MTDRHIIGVTATNMQKKTTFTEILLLKLYLIVLLYLTKKIALREKKLAITAFIPFHAYPLKNQHIYNRNWLVDWLIEWLICYLTKDLSMTFVETFERNWTYICSKVVIFYPPVICSPFFLCLFWQTTLRNIIWLL